MSGLSPNFKRGEFACPCGNCDLDTIDVELLLILEHIRDHFDRPITITSGHRCAEYNKKIGGGLYSQHLYGRAADIVVKGVPANLVQELCENLEVPGLGSYDNFTHIDTRTDRPARW